MSALDGFYTTWNNARQTFGQGTPQSGSDFDKSPQLTTLGSGLDAAAPGSQWSGAAATNYGKANTDHQVVFTKLAELDRKIAQQVDQSAQVVATGRQNLDQLRQWVTDAANSVPPGKQRDAILMQIANRGLGQLTEVVQKTNAESNVVAQNLAKLGPEFEAVSREQKFGNGDKDDKKDDVQTLGNEEMHAVPENERAERDVQAALAGDQGAAARVDAVLSKIDLEKGLSPEQGSYLSQMQAQQNGMSVDDLHKAEERLGDHKNIIGDSWQLMSNEDVWMPHTELEEGALDDPSWRVKGGFDQLPVSVQETLREADKLTPLGEGVAGLTHDQELQRISEIVRDGNDSFQTGTAIDREMINAADKIMDTNLGPLQPMGDPEVVQGLFDAVNTDHQVIHDHLIGSGGDDFLHDVNAVEWKDDGKSAASLFSWTHDAAGGPEQVIAGETAEKYAAYVGSHKDLMNIDGETLGQVNPELVKGYAHGLTPYIADIAGLSTADAHNGFDSIDLESPAERPVAKGLFSVLSTQSDAYTEFQGATNSHILAESKSWADEVKQGHPMSAHDARLTDCATLKALGMTGTTEAARALGLNAEQVYNQQKAAYDFGLAALSGGGSVVPGVGPALGPGLDVFGTAMASSILGPPPDTNSPTIANMYDEEGARFVVNALIANGVDVPGIDAQWMANLPVNPSDPNGPTGQQVLPFEELAKLGVTQAQMSQGLNDLLTNQLGASNPAAAFISQYNNVIKNPSPHGSGT
ncbi:EspA/EspE family type VII secretion system effector [Mycobacterium sp. GA-2829]|uniref:TPR repeat region-containing protein n=1 Tax=Mycobacterium sp. GA-2829 TaxID=1772283 RepID=UPI0007401299|nr:EspA/EspE family type VII secretion system effector [Mycobacterium sp. GA-2829]KUI36784.1 hypothetical protein AU194_23120 [Mycobacterium sp. GA-2829]